MRGKNFILVLAGILSFAASASAQPIDRISIERTSGMGDFAYFKFVVLQNGTVFYEGRGRVKHSGLYRTQILPSVFKDAVKTLTRGHVWTLEKTDYTSITDVPITHVMIANGKRVRRFIYETSINYPAWFSDTFARVVKSVENSKVWSPVPKWDEGSFWP